MAQLLCGLRYRDCPTLSSSQNRSSCHMVSEILGPSGLVALWDFLATMGWIFFSLGHCYLSPLSSLVIRLIHCPLPATDTWEPFDWVFQLLSSQLLCWFHNLDFWLHGCSHYCCSIAVIGAPWQPLVLHYYHWCPCNHLCSMTTTIIGAPYHHRCSTTVIVHYSLGCFLYINNLYHTNYKNSQEKTMYIKTFTDPNVVIPKEVKQRMSDN